jgi:CMP-2-keto-3-deoxyoctulosonic acid synthetase
MTILGVIPARYASTRFPGKPLALIAGKTLIERVIAQCRLAQSLSDVVVATDDERIAAVASRFALVEMTSPDHPSGTDRIAELARQRPADAYVNTAGETVTGAGPAIRSCPRQKAANQKWKNRPVDPVPRCFSHRRPHSVMSKS